MNAELLKDELIFAASVCDKCCIHGKAAALLIEAVKRGFELDIDQREILSSSFKARISPLRNSWRYAKSSNRGMGPNNGSRGISGKIIEDLETRIRTISLEFLELLEGNIIPTITSYESRVYYLKLQADYTRYIAELSSGPEHMHLTERTHNIYKKASEIAICHLSANNPVRMNLMLNFSVFYYEVYNCPERACILAKAAFNHAVESGVLDFDEEDRHKDAKAIMTLIKRNLSLWTNQAVALTYTVSEKNIS